VILALGTIYGMGANHYAAGLNSYRVDQVTERGIVDLETAIRRKQSQSDSLSAKRWIGAARKLERQIDTMRLELSQLRMSFTHTKSSAGVATTTLLEIFIRFVLTICNAVLSLRLIGERQCSKFSKPQTTAMKFPLIVISERETIRTCYTCSHTNLTQDRG
jgi:hypothetical protein